MGLSQAEKDNVTRWDGARKGFYEVYYLKWNDTEAGTAGWIRYTLDAPQKGPPLPSLWAIFFDAKDPTRNVALKHTVPLSDLRIERDLFYFGLGPSAIYQMGARGEIADDSHRISWELKFDDEGISLRHFPSLLYYGGFPRTKFLAPHLSTRISGEFNVDGRPLTLKGVPAHQAHLWGKEMAHSWAWSNCNTFREDPSFCFEGLTAQVQTGGRLSPPLTLLFFLWEGKLYRFNSPRQWFRNKSTYQLDRWVFEAATDNLLFAGEIFSRPEKMVGVRYDNPTGGNRYCHNTKLADIKLQVMRNEKGGWKTVKTLTAQDSVGFEVVAPTHDPRVRLMID